MKLAGFEQVAVDGFNPRHLDVMVAASGYEERAVFVPQRFDKLPGIRLRLGYTEHADDAVRRRNDHVFAELKYVEVSCSGDDYYAACQALEGCVRLVSKRQSRDRTPLRIGLDISSMTRTWMWGLTKWVASMERSAPVELFFFYTPARFTPPSGELIPPKSLGPIPGLSNALELPQRNIALLVGLGYESDRALGVVEYIDPSRTWLFYSNPAADPRFINEVEAANGALIERAGLDSVIPYRLEDLAHTLALLDSLVGRLVLSSRVVIAPLGPKPFAFLAFVEALRYPEVDVWRVSGGAGAMPQYREAAGPVLIGKLSWRPDRSSA